MNIRKIALACGASAAIVATGVGLGSAAAVASPAPTVATAHSSTASTPPWRAQEASSAIPEACSHDYVVVANGVRVHKWPLVSAPTVGLAYYGQSVGVLDFYSDGWAKISWHGTEEWMSSRYIVDEGLCW